MKLSRILLCILLIGILPLCACGEGSVTETEHKTDTGVVTESDTEPSTVPGIDTETDTEPEDETAAELETESEDETESETESETVVIEDVMIGETLDAPYAESFTVSNVFSSDMVVQRGEHIRVWGFAEASENGHKVSGEFMGMFAEALIEDGAWTLTFGARLEASAELGHTMRIYTDKQEYCFENVLVGDVFMVIGQSNVAYSVANHRSYIANPERGGNGYDDETLPIRLHYNSLTQNTGVKRGTDEVCAELRNGSRWRYAEGGTLSNFSALGYMFAVEYAKRVEVPVGVIEIDGNGQPIGAFMSNAAAEATGSDSWSESKGYYTTAGYNGDAARYMYNHYMYPFEKYAIAGVIWYQGESDCESGLAEAFPAKLAALMTHMRSTHNLIHQDFPVYLIEFPTIYRQSAASIIPAGQGWAFMDFGLVRATLGSTVHLIPNSYIVPSSDLWADNTFWNSLHPNCKFEQAERAAEIAAAVSGQGELASVSGPILASAVLSEDGKQVILTYANVGDGLTTTDGGTAVSGFWGVLMDKRGVLRKLKSPEAAEITAPNQITLTFKSSVGGIVYHVEAEEFFGKEINLTSSSGVPAGADMWLFK